MKKHVSGDKINAVRIQRYAIDSEDAIMDVRQIQNRADPFFCPACHDLMIPKMGKVKA